MVIIIIGGGAAGFMAAISAAESFPAAQITILEKNRSVLNKVRISGGGRCNVTSATFDNRTLLKNYPRGENLLKKLLPQFNARSTVEWFQQRGVELKTEPDSRMFPVTDTSETIISCFLNQASKQKIDIRTNVPVHSFKFDPSPGATTSRFTIKLTDQEILRADRVLVATGGSPKRDGYTWLLDHDHEIESPVPSLFTFNTPNGYLLPLAGVSVPEVVVSIMGTKYQWNGPILITHRGLSGPAVLKLSAWGAKVLADVNYQFTCRINWVAGQGDQAVLAVLIQQKSVQPKKMVSTASCFGLPHRLWKAFLEQVLVQDEMRWGDISHKSLNRLANHLTNDQIEVKGKSTYKEEFVTAGGISLTQINQKTLESIHVPGLYFAGEVLDVDGITGGFNFQSAWTTGYIAGKEIGKELTI